MSQVSKFQKFFCSLFYFMILLLSMQKIREKDTICKFWYLKLVRTPLINLLHGFKINFLSLSLCTYITQMDVMLDFICMGPVDLPGARRKRQNTKWKISCPQWDSNPQPFDSKSDALPTELAGLGECCPFKWPYYIHHVLPILMYTLL